MTRPTKLKLAAYAVLLLTLFLPFSRCSHGTPAPAPPPAVTTPAPPNESPADPPQQPVPPSSPSLLTPSPWYHLFERNSPEAEYKYGMDLLIESWAVPTTITKDFDLTLLVPGRMFYVWPLATLAVALWWPPVRWRRSFHAIEAVLALGGIWWAVVAVSLNDAMRGFYIAVSVLAVYALTAGYEWVVAWRRLRRERLAAPPAGD